MVSPSEVAQEAQVDKVEIDVEKDQQMDVNPEEQKNEAQEAQELENSFENDTKSKKISESEVKKDLLGEALRGDKDIIGSHITSSIEVEFKDHTSVHDNSAVKKEVQEIKEDEKKESDETHQKIEKVQNQENLERENAGN